MSNYFEKIKLKHFAILPYVILIIGFFLTIGVTYKFYQDAKNNNQFRFDQDVKKINLTIEDNLNQQVYLIQSLQGFIEAEEILNSKKIDDYLKSLELHKNFRSIQGIGYSKIFNTIDGESLTKRLKDEGFDNFNEFPNEEKIVHQSTFYLKPTNEDNEKKYDISKEPFSPATFDRAKDSGKATATQKLYLFNTSPNKKQAGFLVYLPIYKQADVSAPIDVERKTVIGFVYVSFNANEFTKSVKEKALMKDIGITIFDGQNKPENLLSETIEDENQNQNLFDTKYQTSEEINFAGRNWIVKYDSLSNFTGQSTIGWTPLIFFTGIGMSILLFGLTYWQSSSKGKLQHSRNALIDIEKQKQKLHESEQQSRLIAERANMAKGEFMSVVSHELRTPLNAISGWINILKSENLPSDVNNLAVEKIEEGLRMQTKLIEELLDYSRIVSGEIPFEKEEIEFSNMFENIYPNFESLATRKNIQMLKDNQLDGQKIFGNEGLVKIALQNLLKNAVKFTDSGGQIDVKIRAELGKIEMVIKDNGEGISQEYLPKVFDLFSQADTSTTRNHGGFGLGLSISNRVLKMHDGFIVAESEGHGKGSTFTVRIPCKID